MELIISNGEILGALEHYPEIKKWVEEWLSDKTMFTFETSGTTGAPKQLIFSREQLIASAKRTCDFFSLTPGTKVLHRLPMQFVAGKMNIVRGLVMKHTVWADKPSMHFDENWNQEGLIWDWWPTTPAMLTSFLEKDLSLNIFGKILLGGGKVPIQLEEKLLGIKTKCFESYGATETLTHIAVRQIDGTPGYFTPLSGVIVEKNDHGIQVKDSVTGIETLLSDEVEMHEGKGFGIWGRVDDVINSGGLKIHPLMVEELLGQHTSLPFFISQMPDEKWGNIIVLVVLAGDMHLWTKFDFKEIFRLQPLWKPKKIIGIKELDRNENGKMVRKFKNEEVVDSFEQSTQD